MRRKRIIVGKTAVLDSIDADVNPLIQKQMITRGRRLLVTSDHFDPDLYVRSGAFLSKSFWHYNLLWLQKGSLSSNLAFTSAFLLDYNGDVLSSVKGDVM